MGDNKIFDDGNSDNDLAACDKLDEFIANVESKSNSGKPEDAETAPNLIADANAVQPMLDAANGIQASYC